MKRILFISSQPYFQWRGSPIRVAFDVQALAELGYEVDLLTLPVGSDRAVPGVNVIRAPNIFFAREVPIGPSLIKAAFDAVLFVMGLWLAARRRYTVIHGVEDAGTIGLVISGIVRCRNVFEKHSDPGSYKGGFIRRCVMRAYAGVENLTARHSDAVICTGAGLYEQVKKCRAGVGAHHISDLPSSLVESTEQGRAVARKRFEQKPGEIIVLYVGSFASYQGVDLIFEAAPIVVRNQPNVRFVIIGGAASETGMIRKRMEAEGIADAISFIGKVEPDALPDYLAAADILLSPRLSGVNTPMKLLDYMKAGRAVAATDTTANRLLLDEETALLVPVNAKAYADAILKLVRDAGLREKLGKNGRRLLDKKYGYEGFKQKLRECYASMGAL